jgi:hypothetical protein
MQISPDSIRLLILLCMVVMGMLAAFSLRRRELPIRVYAFWGLVAVLIPLIGPFIVIWIQPGNKRN